MPREPRSGATGIGRRRRAKGRSVLGGSLAATVTAAAVMAVGAFGAGASMATTGLSGCANTIGAGLGTASGAAADGSADGGAGTLKDATVGKGSTIATGSA